MVQVLVPRVIVSVTVTTETAGAEVVMVWNDEVVVVVCDVVVEGAIAAVVVVVLAVLVLPLASALARNCWKVFPVAGAFTANTIP